MQISAKIADPTIASYSWGSYTSGRTVPVNIIAKKIGTTTITFKILDGETGQTAAEKVVPVSVDVPSSTVTFNANGGTVYPSQKTVKYSLSYGELPVPTRENYQFDGWYTASGTPVTKNTVVSSAQNHTLYAYWTQIIIPVRSVSISSTSETLFLGETCQLTAYVLPANATNTGIEWHSDNPIVASVTSTGVVTAYKAGTAVITAVSADGRAAASCLITVTDVAASGTTGDANTVNWVLTANGTLTISGSGDMSNYSSSKTDALWQDKYCAQHHNVKVQKVVIQRGVTSIGNGAFSGCNDLTEVAIPGSVKIIGKSAFLRCSNLTSLTIEKGVVTIESGAFSGCSSLTHVTIPDSVTSIGQSAFNKCVSLSSVEIPSSVKSIGRTAFNECKSLSSLTLAKGVTDIGDYAFRACNSLCSLPIPSSVRSIGNGAFSKCSGLTSAIIPSSVTSMGGSVFYGCANLVYAVILGNLASTGEWTFGDCSKLSNVILENGVKTIGYCTFYGCSSLSSITIPNSVTYIDSYAFDGCSSLSSVTVSSRVSFVGDFAFQNCSGLTNITIPSSISSIGAGAFNYCASLKDVYFTGTKDQWAAVNIGSRNENLLNATIHCAGLGVPTMTAKLGGDGKPVVSWTKVNGAAQYEVYRSDTGKDNSFKIIRRTAGLTYTDTAAAAGKTYYYVVRAIDGSTAGKFCAAKSVAVSGALGVPTITLTTASKGNPVIKWTKVNGAAQYEVYRSDTGKDNTFKIIRRTAGLTFTDTAAAAGKTYYYVVRAINGSTAGKFCAAKSVAVALGVPTMTLKLGSDGKPVVSWTKVNGAAQYEVYRSDTGKDNTFKIIRRTAGLTFTDTAAAAGKTYYYVVRAINGSTAGKFCAAKSVAVALGVPTMTVKLGSDGKPVVSWTKVAGAAQYEVYRSLTGKANSYSIIRRTAGLTFTDTAAAAGKTYYYVVRAINGGAAGKFCAAKSVTAQMALGVPTMTLGIDLSDGLTTVWWSKVANAAQYEIYRSDSGKSGTFKIVRRTAGTFWKDNTAQVGKTYYYTVRAMRGSGTSVVYGGFCPVQERVCSQPPTLESPYFYYMDLNSSGKPVLKWEGVPDADYYVIFRTDNNGFSIRDIGYVEAGSELTYTDTTAVAGVRYGYSVSCETYEGAYSAPSDQYYITAR